MLALATQKKPTKFESAVMTSMEDFSSKLEGFESMMKPMLDKLAGLEAWRATADASMDKLLVHATTTADRTLQFEVAPSAQPPPPPPPPPQPRYPPRPSTAPPQPLSRWTNPFDLNVAP